MVNLPGNVSKRRAGVGERGLRGEDYATVREISVCPSRKRLGGGVIA
jgi:hypothetical protein